MFHLACALPSFYVLARIVWPLPWAPGVKIVLAVILLETPDFGGWRPHVSGMSL